jgi:hypothetical protein
MMAQVHILRGEQEPALRALLVSAAIENRTANPTGHGFRFGRLA